MLSCGCCLLDADSGLAGGVPVADKADSGSGATAAGGVRAEESCLCAVESGDGDKCEPHGLEE